LMALTLLNVILHDNPASGVRKIESACGWICDLPQLMLWTAPPPAREQWQDNDERVAFSGHT
jgi:hypothetical protein